MCPPGLCSAASRSAQTAQGQGLCSARVAPGDRQPGCRASSRKSRTQQGASTQTQLPDLSTVLIRPAEVLSVASTRHTLQGAEHCLSILPRSVLAVAEELPRFAPQFNEKNKNQGETLFCGREVKAVNDSLTQTPPHCIPTQEDPGSCSDLHSQPIGQLSQPVTPRATHSLGFLNSELPALDKTLFCKGAWHRQSRHTPGSAGPLPWSLLGFA